MAGKKREKKNRKDNGVFESFIEGVLVGLFKLTIQVALFFMGGNP